MDVQGDHREGDDAGEAVGAMRRHPVEAAVPEVVDRRFNRRMPTAHRDECVILLAFPFRLVETALLRQHVVIEQLVEPAAFRRILPGCCCLDDTVIRKP